ncbi:MAG TPA: hypothetical protein DEQ30_10575 [Porphyromonadaceae bacterium]|nr:hypothetical protein [Porphyromonadaceae bacterium]
MFITVNFKKLFIYSFYLFVFKLKYNRIIRLRAKLEKNFYRSDKKRKKTQKNCTFAYLFKKRL